MEATDILMSEHRVIERVIAILEIAAEKLENGETVRVVSEDTYDAMAQIVYVGVQQRN